MSELVDASFFTLLCVGGGEGGSWDNLRGREERCRSERMSLKRSRESKKIIDLSANYTNSSTTSRVVSQILQFNGRN